mmetsp:Transcript_17058/g.40101  ORF Transcript_17058/g.40101 Transcript_17058/m.40101 type:complete len:272 (-) Transcript_17058:604-1419(-)
MSRTNCMLKPSTSSAISAKGRWMRIVMGSAGEMVPHPGSSLAEEVPQLSREVTLSGNTLSGLVGGAGCTSPNPSESAAPPPSGAEKACTGARSSVKAAGGVGPTGNDEALSPQPLAAPPKAPKSAWKAVGPTAAPKPLASDPKARLPSLPPVSAKGGEERTEVTTLTLKVSGPFAPQVILLLSKTPNASLQASSLSFFFFFSFLLLPLPGSEPGSEVWSAGGAPAKPACDSTGEGWSRAALLRGKVVASDGATPCPSAAAISLASRSSSSS